MYLSHISTNLYTFCVKNLAGIVLLILYTKCIQKFVKMLYTFCGIHLKRGDLDLFLVHVMISYLTATN